MAKLKYKESTLTIKNGVAFICDHEENLTTIPVADINAASFADEEDDLSQLTIYLKNGEELEFELDLDDDEEEFMEKLWSIKGSKADKADKDE